MLPIVRHQTTSRPDLGREEIRGDEYIHVGADKFLPGHANQGVTINEIHNVYGLPKSLQGQWAAYSYHGSEEHNSRAVLNRYLGYWDANPAMLTAAVAGQLGVQIHFVDSWYYHIGDGGIHCGTNVLHRPRLLGRPNVWDAPDAAFRSQTIIFDDEPVEGTGTE